jgi:hypothetical protein
MSVLCSCQSSVQSLASAKTARTVATDCEAVVPPPVRARRRGAAPGGAAHVGVPCGEPRGGSPTVSLAYLGNGRLCMCRSVTVELSTHARSSFKGKGTCFTVLDLTRSPGAGGDGELQLATCGLMGSAGTQTFFSLAWTDGKHALFCLYKIAIVSYISVK